MSMVCTATSTGLIMACLEQALPCQVSSVEDYACLLQQAKQERNRTSVLRLYGDIRKSKLDAHPALGNQLILILVELGHVSDAQQVFDRLAHPHECSWNILVAGYIKCGKLRHALRLHKQMQEDGSVHPTAHIFVDLLKACAKLKHTERGQQLHAHIIKTGLLQEDAFVASSLVSMYAKCGLLEKAQAVFNKLSARNVVLWNGLITGYVDNGRSEEALHCFEQMHLEGIAPDTYTYASSLKACANIRAIIKGQQLHGEILRKRLENDLVVGSTLVSMYAKCGLLAESQDAFDKLPVRDVVSWNALMSGYLEHGYGEQALKCFECMQQQGVSPNATTYVCSLKACAWIGATTKGQEIHAEISRRGFEGDLEIGNTLISMYAKCGLLAKSQEVFDNLLIRDVVSWNALIAGYVEQGFDEESLRCFAQMQVQGINPNSITFICSLKACVSSRAVDRVQEIHAQISKEGLEGASVVASTLVSTYCKCGSLAKAEEVFDKLSVRDIVTWNALITGYMDNGCGEKALKCLDQMDSEGVSPNATTFSCIIKVCTNIGAIDKGQKLHAEISREGWESDVAVGNALVSMYAKSGLLGKAHRLFHMLPTRDIVSWSALMAGYTLLGETQHVFDTFEGMLAEGIYPNVLTVTSVLTACTHTGLVEKGVRYFETLSNNYNIIPTLEHYTCMVDLLGRAGQVSKMVAVIKKLPFCADLVFWLTVLDACSKWGELELGRWAFEHALQLDANDNAAYVCMSNICHDSGM